MTKLDASGAALGYSTYLGGSDYDFGHGIALDGAGSAYLTGYTGSANFPTTAGAFDTTYNGDDDAFVTKLDASGAALGYSTFLGGGSTDGGLGIALDGAGSAYLTGYTARRTSRRPRAPSTRPGTAPRRLRDEARPRRRPATSTSTSASTTTSTTASTTAATTATTTACHRHRHRRHLRHRRRHHRHRRRRRPLSGAWCRG